MSLFKKSTKGNIPKSLENHPFFSWVLGDESLLLVDLTELEENHTEHIFIVDVNNSTYAHYATDSHGMNFTRSKYTIEKHRINSVLIDKYTDQIGSKGWSVRNGMISPSLTALLDESDFLNKFRISILEDQLKSIQLPFNSVVTLCVFGAHILRDASYSDYLQYLDKVERRVVEVSSKADELIDQGLFLTNSNSGIEEKKAKGLRENDIHIEEINIDQTKKITEFLRRKRLMSYKDFLKSNT